jgi:hypothetical protein
VKLSVHKLAARIGQEFKRLRKQIADLELTFKNGSLAGPPGPQGEPGKNGSAGPAGAAGVDGSPFLVYDLPMASAPTNLATGFSASYVLPAPPTVTGHTFTGIRIIRDSRLALNILPTATTAFVAATVIEYPILNVFEVQSSAAGFVPFYVHRRLHLAGSYADGVATGVLSEEFSTEAKLRSADFTPDGVESITLADLGHYIPEYVEDGVLLAYDTGSERVWERVRFEYEYSKTIASLSVTPSTTDETVVFGGFGPVGSSDGSISVAVTGGSGPYSLEINGVGVVATGSSPLVYSGLPGATDYEFRVTDSFGNAYPSIGYETVHVYREAFSISFDNTSTLSIQFTGWSRSLSFSQYDESAYIGTLSLVELYQTISTARSTARIENTGLTPGTAATAIDISIGVEYPAATVIGSDTTTVSFTNSLAAFDGIPDFGGASGVSNARRVATKTTTHSIPITPTSDFVGAGTVSLTITGSASGSVSGLSSYLLSAAPELGASVVLRYTVTGARE